jgi:hypothetical protein
MLSAYEDKFVEGILSGMNQTDAYKYAYSTENMALTTVYVEAWNVMHRPKVAQRIQEYREMAHSGTIMQLQEMQERLSEIARGKLTDFVADDGTITTDAPNNASIAELSVEEYGGNDMSRRGNKTRRIKLHNPVAAMQELAKLRGDYAPERKQIAARVVLDVEYVDKGQVVNELE